MKLLSLGRRPTSLGSECIVSYQASEAAELGLAVLRSGQLFTNVRNLAGAVVDQTGVEGQAPAYMPRLSAFDDGAGGQVAGQGIPLSMGLMVEPGRVNSLTYSRDISNAAWTKSGTTVAISVDFGPDNKTLAYKLKEDNTNAVHTLGRATPALTASTYQPFSFSIKAAERTWAYVVTVDKANVTKRTWINLGTGAVGTQAAGHVVAVRYRVGGWWRVALSFDSATGATAPTIAVGLATGDGVFTYTGTTGSGAYVTDLQFETDGRYATSPIFTSAAAVTRGAESAGLVVQIPIPDTFTVYLSIERPLHADLGAAVVVPFAFMWQWGAIGADRFAVYFQDSARNISAIADAAAVPTTCSRAIPAGRRIQLCAQYQGVRTTGTQVRLDVNDGAGFTAWGAASARINSLSSYAMTIGETGAGANALGSSVEIVRVKPGLRTLTEMQRTR